MSLLQSTVSKRLRAKAQCSFMRIVPTINGGVSQMLFVVSNNPDIFVRISFNPDLKVGNKVTVSQKSYHNID